MAPSFHATDSNNANIVLDCVRDLGVPFDTTFVLLSTMQRIYDTAMRVPLLHSTSTSS